MVLKVKKDLLAGSYVQNNEPVIGLLPLQTAVSNPDVEGLERATGLLNPPLTTVEYLKNFPSDLYDLRPQSHLSRFLKALLGDSGSGQLHKRNTIARLSAILGGSHFFDLDGLYGAIFNNGRQSVEQLPIDPMDAIATPEEWDELRSRDARYRSRIDSLAKAISLGGTVPGLVQLAEAITGHPCEIYEIWKIIDIYGSESGVTYSWNYTEGAYSTWADINAEIWGDLSPEGVPGRSEINNRSEFVVRVRKDYTQDADGERQQQEDIYTLNKVLSRLKPAGTLLTIQNTNVPVNRDIGISGLYSDNDFWEISMRRTPKPGLEKYYLNSSASALNVSQSINGATMIPTPPFAGSVGHKYTASINVASVAGYALDANNNVVASENWDHMGPRGSVRDTFTPDRGVIDGRTAIASLLAEDNLITSHPYADVRFKPDDIV